MTGAARGNPHPSRRSRAGGSGGGQGGRQLRRGERRQSAQRSSLQRWQQKQSGQGWRLWSFSWRSGTQILPGTPSRRTKGIAVKITAEPTPARDARRSRSRQRPPSRPPTPRKTDPGPRTLSLTPLIEKGKLVALVLDSVGCPAHWRRRHGRRGGLSFCASSASSSATSSTSTVRERDGVIIRR